MLQHWICIALSHAAWSLSLLQTCRRTRQLLLVLLVMQVLDAAELRIADALLEGIDAVGAAVRAGDEEGSLQIRDLFLEVPDEVLVWRLDVDLQRRSGSAHAWAPPCNYTVASRQYGILICKLLLQSPPCTSG